MAELKSCPATLTGEHGKAKGRLVLDGRRLRFDPDDDPRPTWWEISDIKRLVRARTALVVPNALAMTMRNGESARIVVDDPKAWIREIEGVYDDLGRR